VVYLVLLRYFFIQKDVFTLINVTDRADQGTIVALAFPVEPVASVPFSLVPPFTAV
jgi:hypothetical protein